MRRIVVLTAGFGEGHNSAARNLAESLNLIPGVVATVHDPLVAFGERYEKSKRSYLSAISGSPGLWRIGYHALDRLPLMRASLPFLGLAERKLEAILRETGADTAVSTYPLYPLLLRRIAKRGGPAVKIGTVVTDSITINRVWSATPSDFWLTADRYSARILAGLGVSADRIHSPGFCVSPKFSREKAGVREIPGENSRPAKVLLMAGTAAKDTVATALALSAIPGVALTVTVGRKAELGREVEAALAAHGRSATILGWSDAMPAILREHHIMLGKAGGATTHETLAARTPFVITHVLPGQEEGNARLIERIGGGVVATTPETAAEAVRAMLKDNGRLWATRVDNIARHSRADGGLRAAQTVIRETGGVPGGADSLTQV